jgi:hypothetical protein
VNVSGVDRLRIKFTIGTSKSVICDVSVLPRIFSSIVSLIVDGFAKLQFEQVFGVTVSGMLLFDQRPRLASPVFIVEDGGEVE